MTLNIEELREDMMRAVMSKNFEDDAECIVEDFLDRITALIDEAKVDEKRIESTSSANGELLEEIKSRMYRLPYAEFEMDEADEILALIHQHSEQVAREARAHELAAAYVDGDVVMTYLPHGVEAPLKSSERIAKLTKSETKGAKQR